VLHVNAHALLIHPTFSIIRIVGKVWGIFLSWRRPPVTSIVCPKLISTSAKKTLAILIRGEDLDRLGKRTHGDCTTLYAGLERGESDSRHRIVHERTREFLGHAAQILMHGALGGLLAGLGQRKSLDERGVGLPRLRGLCKD
jgi:hypothetical protein